MNSPMTNVLLWKSDGCYSRGRTKKRSWKEIKCLVFSGALDVSVQNDRFDIWLVLARKCSFSLHREVRVQGHVEWQLYIHHVAQGHFGRENACRHGHYEPRWKRSAVFQLPYAHRKLWVCDICSHVSFLFPGFYASSSQCKSQRRNLVMSKNGRNSVSTIFIETPRLHSHFLYNLNLWNAVNQFLILSIKVLF